MPDVFRKDIKVRDRYGIAADARLAVCECGCEEFVVYVLATHSGRHAHLQCVRCGVSHCDGRCDDRCAHGVPDGEWCPDCTAETRQARMDNGIDDY